MSVHDPVLDCAVTAHNPEQLPAQFDGHKSAIDRWTPPCSQLISRRGRTRPATTGQSGGAGTGQGGKRANTGCGVRGYHPHAGHCRRHRRRADGQAGPSPTPFGALDSDCGRVGRVRYAGARGPTVPDSGLTHAIVAVWPDGFSMHHPPAQKPAQSSRRYRDGLDTHALLDGRRTPMWPNHLHPFQSEADAARCGSSSGGMPTPAVPTGPLRHLQLSGFITDRDENPGAGG